MSQFRLYLISVLLVGLFASCGPERLDDFSDVSYELVNQNGEEVLFPDDFQGSPLVLGFIYTNCPDICSFITANVGDIYNEMDSPGDTQFALITFDPQRDTPEVLKRYADSFGMDQKPFHFLTADSTTIANLMERVSVRVKESYSQELESGQRAYFLNHSDKILLIDSESRLVFDYGGSMTPPELIIEDLQKL
jgi:protein SCO1/2